MLFLSKNGPLSKFHLYKLLQLKCLNHRPGSLLISGSIIRFLEFVLHDRL